MTVHTGMHTGGKKERDGWYARPISLGAYRLFHTTPPCQERSCPSDESNAKVPRLPDIPSDPRSSK